MASKGRKIAAMVERRKKTQPSESRSQGGHTQHVPGSQNLNKN